MNHKIMRVTDRPELIRMLAEWFSDKWGIPKQAYIDSMTDACKTLSAVPQWYAVFDGGQIIGGAGVIENDFHDRPDLTPNVCAVYVIPEARCRGIAGELLEYISFDMKAKGIDTLYLVTDHTSFYERYGWKYLCPVHSNGEDTESRMYVKRLE